jgi:hypothetical protein
VSGSLAQAWPIYSITVDGERRVACDVRIAGRSARAELDTGASAHAVTLQAAARLELPLAGQRSLLTPHGDRVVPFTPPIAITLGDGGGVERPVAVIDRRSLDAAHLVGSVSPQLLVTAEEMIELDLRRGTARRRSTGERPSADSASALTAHPAGAGGRVYVVAARVGNQDVRLLVDTGALTTVVFSDTVVGLRAAERLVSPTTPSAPTSISVGGAIFDVPIGVWNDPPNRAELSYAMDGVLGLDVLGSCRILLGERGGELACVAP